MTTGSRDMGDVHLPRDNIGFVGLNHVKTWVGGDRPQVVRTRSQPSYIYRTLYYRVAKGKNKGQLRSRTVRYKYYPKSLASSPPPERRSAQEHSYFMETWRSSSEWVTFSFPDNTHPTFMSVDLASPIGFNPGWLQNPLFDANDDLKLLNKLKEKLQGSDFNMSVFLGEGHQTLTMLADSAIRINKAYSHLRRGDLAGTARSLFDGTNRSPIKPYSSMKRFNSSNRTALANNWIELQYGWRPLVDDAKSMAELLAHQLSVPLEERVSVSSRKEAVGKHFTYQGYHPPPGGGDPFYYGTYGKYSKTQFKRLTCFVQERPSMLAVLGLTDPASLIWEKLPWSFVADWFIPIGDYLAVRGLSSLYPGVYVSSSLLQSRNFPLEGFRSDNGAAGSFTHPDGFLPPYRAHQRYAAYSRTVGTSPSVPLPKFKSLAKAASWQHAANAIALLTQRFAGKT